VTTLIDGKKIALDIRHHLARGVSELPHRTGWRPALATVTVAHRHTRDLTAVTRDADILVVAAGVPGLVGREHVTAGRTVFGVGINRAGEGSAGDVRPAELTDVAARVTLVPGGVGPSPIAMLMANTLQAATWQLDTAGTAS